MWKDKTVDFAKATWTGVGLFALGILGSFPIFFQMFTAK
jgi:hypothetical protein